MDKKLKLVWIIFLSSLLIGLIGFLRLQEIINFWNWEIWHIIFFISSGIFFFFLALLLQGKNSKLFLFLSIIFYSILIFLIFDWEIPLRTFSFLLDYTISSPHFFEDFFGLTLSIIFNLFFYFKFLKK